MTITRIQKLHGHLCEIYLDNENEPVAQVDSSYIEEYPLKEGKEIDIETIKELSFASVRRRCKSKALWLLGRQDYSVKSLKQKLTKDYSSTVVDEIIDYLVDINYLNDERYAENMLRGLIAQRKYGKNRIRQYMYTKGISSETISLVMEDYEEDEVPVIYDLLIRKYPGYREDVKIRNRAFNAMVRYGYGFSDIKRAMEIEETEEYDEE